MDTAAYMAPEQAPGKPVARFVLPLGYESLPLRSSGTGVAFAPDGTSIVYAGQPILTSAPVLYRRRLNALDVERIPNTEGAYAPFFSPDATSSGGNNPASRLAPPAPHLPPRTSRLEPRVYNPPHLEGK